ncbi:putative isoaspartyl peptidase/L-asparaginase 2, partial [Mucuna pruriens]
MGKQHNYKEERMVGLTVVSNFGDVAYGFNCNGMFRGCATEDGFMKLKFESSLDPKIMTLSSIIITDN